MPRRALAGRLFSQECGHARRANQRIHNGLPLPTRQRKIRTTAPGAVGSVVGADDVRGRDGCDSTLAWLAMRLN
jgi:hypothetical protein